MNNSEKINLIIRYLEKAIKNEGTGHDYWHALRVRKMALRIAEKEKNIDRFIIELAALLHDLDDWKFSKSYKDQKNIKKLLEKYRIDKEAIQTIVYIAKNLSFKGSGSKIVDLSKEGQIVQDADRLDALGALGIARVFAFSGFANNPIYDPGIKPKIKMTFKQYRKSKSTAINHFYEKLLLLKDLMNTETARKIALVRQEFMERYLDEFYKEWDGVR